MTPRIAPKTSRSQNPLARHARTALGAMIVAGAAVLAIGAAAVAALAAITLVGILAMVGALIYLFARIRFRQPATAPSAGPLTLDARRTGAGWRVDALGRFGG